MKKQPWSLSLNLLLFLMITLFFSECKKGSGDPDISVRSRKNRLTGDWRLEGGKATAFNYQYIFNKSGARVFDVVNMLYSDELYQFNLTISKDGTFSMNEIRNLSSFHATGNWNFNTGVGENKKKEMVFFHISEVTRAFTFGYHVFNQSSANFSYYITELRNKKLVLHFNGIIYTENHVSENFSGDYTLIQD
jgi:hypothetical protein